MIISPKISRSFMRGLLLMLFFILATSYTVKSEECVYDGVNSVNLAECDDVKGVLLKGYVVSEDGDENTSVYVEREGKTFMLKLGEEKNGVKLISIDTKKVITMSVDEEVLGWSDY